MIDTIDSIGIGLLSRPEIYFTLLPLPLIKALYVSSLSRLLLPLIFIAKEFAVGLGKVHQQTVPIDFLDFSRFESINNYNITLLSFEIISKPSTHK